MENIISEMKQQVQETRHTFRSVLLTFIVKAVRLLPEGSMLYLRKDLDYDGSLSEIKVKGERRFICGILDEETVVLRPINENDGVRDTVTLKSLSLNSLNEIAKILELDKFKIVKWDFPITKS